MPTNYAKEWGDTYNKAAVVFSTATKEAAKKEKTHGKVLGEIFQGPLSTSGILGCMAALDKIDLTRGVSEASKKAFPKNLKTFKAVLSKFDAEKSKYLKALEEALNAKVPFDEQGFKVSRPMKDGCPEAYRQLKILRTAIEAIHAKAANQCKMSETSDKSDKIGEESEKKKGKVPGTGPEVDDKLKALSEEAALKKLLLTLGTQFKSAMAKGAAVIQKIKASPDLATYNDEMTRGGRDISQQVVNYAKLKANPKFKKLATVKKIPDPGPIAAQIAEFGDGAKRRLPDGTSPQAVKEHLVEFVELYKRIAKTYAAILSGKLG